MSIKKIVEFNKQCTMIYSRKFDTFLWHHAPAQLHEIKSFEYIKVQQVPNESECPGWKFFSDV